MTAHRLKCSHPFSAVQLVRTWLGVIAIAPFLVGARAVRGQHAGGVVSFPLRTSHGKERMAVTIGRRELLAALGGAAAAWPLVARAAGWAPSLRC
jgi:hypothetical protein